MFRLAAFAERAMTAYPFAGLAAGLIRRGVELPNLGYTCSVSEGIGFQKGILRFAIRSVGGVMPYKDAAPSEYLTGRGSHFPAGSFLTVRLIAGISWNHEPSAPASYQNRFA